MIEFLKENWKLILEIVVLLASVIFFIVKKKPVKVIDSVKESLVKVIPQLICMAEEVYPEGHGDKKKGFVLDALRNYLLFNYGQLSSDDINVYLSIGAGLIEDILSTPQKKGE